MVGPLIIAFTGKQSYYNGQYLYLFTQQLYIFIQIKGYKKMYMTVHTFIIGFCTCKSIWLLTELYVVINKTDKTLITCLLIFLFSIGVIVILMMFDILLIEYIWLVLHGFYQCTLFTCNFSLVIQANDFTSWTLFSLTCVCIYMYSGNWQSFT